jgi:putative hydrolase of the HAD superfamily
MLADLDAVTVDAFGTLVELQDPVPALQAALRAHGVERDPAAVEAAFAAESRHYRERKAAATDRARLEALQRECADVFLAALEAPLDPAAFAPLYVGALEFRPIGGALEALRSLRAHGLALAIVTDWDLSASEHLEGLGIDRLVDAVVVSAELGVAKPDPRPFLAALERLAVEPQRTLHVGDGIRDEQGAAAAGLRFAPAPLARLVRREG